MIEIRQLRYFLAIAEEQSITRAAEYLRMSQPALSKQMIDLEERLGKQLLIRDKRRIALTEDGVYLRSRAQEILSLMEKTESAFRESEEVVSGDVYIGCGEHRTSYPIMRLIKKIQEERPGIHFHFFSGNADAITERLDKGLLDMGFLLDPEIDPRYDYQMLPFQETWGVLVRKDSAFAGRDSITFPELSELPLIMPSQVSNSKKITTYFADTLPSPNVVATYNLIYNAGLMVEAGIGYALCIDDLINTEGDHPLTFVPVAPSLQSNVYLFTKKYQTFSKATELFLKRLDEEFQTVQAE